MDQLTSKRNAANYRLTTATIQEAERSRKTLKQMKKDNLKQLIKDQHQTTEAPRRQSIHFGSTFDLKVRRPTEQAESSTEEDSSHSRENWSTEEGKQTNRTSPPRTKTNFPTDTNFHNKFDSPSHCMG